MSRSRDQAGPDGKTERAASVGAALEPEGLGPGPAVTGPAAVLALQRAAGNAAVAGIMPDQAGGHEAAPTETAADASVQRAIAEAVHHRQAPGPAPAPGSPARLLRSRLRANRRLLRVTTSGGDWSTDKYDLLRDTHPQFGPVPPATGLRGVDIELRFKPAPTVDAESIGLTQSVIAFVNNAPSMTPSQAAVAIPAADAKANATGPGESDETAAIDRASGFNNPIYAVDDPASTSLADPSTDPGWGQHGHHFKDSTGALKQQDALLKDIPARTRAQKDSRHIFETAAVATKGAQAGTYYGSVRWGWRTDAGGAFTKIPLAKVSDGVPSSTFMKAAELWNPATSSTGAAHVDLPIVDVKVTTGPVTLTPAGAAVAAPSIGAAVGAASGPVGPLAGPVAATSAAAPVTLPVGTRLQIINAWHPPLLSGTVKVVDGPLTGRVGEVGYAEWGLIVDERA